MPLLSLPGLASALAPRAPTPGAFSIPSPFPTGDLHDFDFFVGTWKSVNRRLEERWVGSDTWDVFPTQGWSGMTVRTFDLEERQWSLYWSNRRKGVLFPPVVGGFKGDHGEFHGDDTDEGRPSKVVFKWTRKGPDLAHCGCWLRTPAWCTSRPLTRIRWAARCRWREGRRCSPGRARLSPTSSRTMTTATIATRDDPSPRSRAWMTRGASSTWAASTSCSSRG